MIFWFHRNISRKEFKIFPPLFFGFDKPVLAIPNLAHLLLPSSDINAVAKSKELNSVPQQIGVLRTFLRILLRSVKDARLRQHGIFCFFIFLTTFSFSQIQQPQTPTFNNQSNQPINGGVNYGNQNIINNNATQKESNNVFKTSYKAPLINQTQNNQTKQILDLYKEADANNNSNVKKQLWELKLRYFKFVNPNSEQYKKYQPLYEAAFDSINQMLKGDKPLDLKKAVFLVENVLFENKLKYSNFCSQIANKLYIINQILKKENLSLQNNIALNYAIQQLYLKPINYIDKNGVSKIHYPFKYDFNDPMGNVDYKNQFVTKLLNTNKGQCHSMPLLYLILATEIGTKASIAYSPNHSYIAFPDNENNYYNFECTSGGFTSYSFIMGSGFVKKEAVKSGIYMLPASTKEIVANQLNDLATQQLFFMQGIDEFQLKCAKKTLDIFPNDIMALQTMANYQSAKTEAATCYAGWPNPQDVPANPELKKEFDNRDNLYNYIDNLGLAQMTEEQYYAWLKSADFEKAKQESNEIKKIILQKAKLKD